MPLQFSRCDDDDLYLKVCWDSFGPGVMGLMYPNGYSEAAMQHNEARIARTRAQFPGRVHTFKVIDTDLPADDPLGRIVGVSRWQITSTQRSDEDFDKEKDWHKKDEAEEGRPPGQNVAFVRTFDDALGALRKKHVGGKPFVHLQSLATRSGHNRRGVGAMHLKWGTDKADELGLPAYVESSPQGWGLYRKWGWNNLERVEIDAEQWGWNNSLEHWVMWREPKEQSSS